MNFLQFYQPPARANLHHDKRPTTSSLRAPPPRWEGQDSATPIASQVSSRVLHIFRSDPIQDLTGPLQKDSFDSFRTPVLGLNDNIADRKIASMPSSHVVTSWDDMIPLSYQSDSDRLHRPRFRYPPGIICKNGILGESVEGKTVCE